MELYAHSVKGSPLEYWQTYHDHSNGVSQLCEKFANKFGIYHVGAILGLYHDVAKTINRWQAYIFHENQIDIMGKHYVGRIMHASPSGKYVIDMFGEEWGLLLAMVICAHHAGLYDYRNPDEGDMQFVEMMENDDVVSICNDIVDDRIPVMSADDLPDFNSLVKKYNPVFLIRMLLSCLVDADRCDTKNFYGKSTRGDFPIIEQFYADYKKFIRNMESKSEDTEVNMIRAEINRNCLRKAKMDCGLFSMTVPTGGGKTFASIGFGLLHAMIHGKDRIIYVAPFTTIIEQTADELRKIFGDENVIEHHSNIRPDMNTEKRNKACENWDAPIIVTTNVMFFESLHAYHPSSCQKLHNIANSVIIYDEPQTLPPDFIYPIIDTMKELDKNYGVTQIMCTATQPALEERNNFEGFKKGSVREIVDKPRELYNRMNAVRKQEYSYMGCITMEDIRDRINERENVLCIVNHRRTAMKLAKMIPGAIYLTTYICGQHRSSIVKEIREKLANGEPCVVISTSLIEAGVDVSFKCVFREFTGLDSVAQSFGRCVRNGEYGIGTVGVFRIHTEHYGHGHLGQCVAASKEFLYTKNPISLDNFPKYFSTLFYQKSDTLDKYSIREILKKMRFRTASREFRLIKNDQVSIIIRTSDNADTINRLYSDDPGELVYIMRRLQRHIISVPRKTIDKMIDRGHVSPVMDYEDLYIASDGSYDFDRYGLAEIIENLSENNLIT